MLTVFEKAALEAGEAILAVYRSAHAVTQKLDLSPVTVADERAEVIILAHLAAAFPDIPVIAEEAVAAGYSPATGTTPFFLVDPLDGTREFIEHRDEFTVNIAYIVDGQPVAGIVYAPALGVAFTGEDGVAEKLMVDADFTIASRAPITARQAGETLTGLASRCNGNDRTDDFLSDNAVSACTMIGSSLKFCLLAEGKADVYPRFARTMEWDTAAGDAVLRAAGGTTVTLDGKPLSYGKRNQPTDSDFANPDFISWGARNTVSGG
ncbi:3'(2'),5'-bisphosphate nucleotidase CysQ [Rhizobium tumorigenes]|uniref:3'(2'),5'-bisphosphate nucleotidase CysQ n=1 Tax=Rhizobium tumorigenes TaxID=2041385 RepID=A0AAF1K8J7_9HYPH|nr:3'(2'),5'-bisphosphate nucleotidase CysQ [Rhizobium tumorigenes]WFR94382.1 3'(2'),5'-bisphosphate nucleotidase CysQ [Rhizobium tumorigenes]